MNATKRNAAGEAANDGHGAPAALLMHVGMVLSGVGTTLVGPILPLLMGRWMLRDSQAGLLLTAQFLGMFLGAILISRRLGRTFLIGICSSLAGFSGLGLTVYSFGPSGANTAGLAMGCVALLIGGFGLGQLITSINLIGGERYAARRGSALSLLNFSWSLGAVLSPLLAAWLTPRFTLPVLLGGFAGAFLLMGLEAAREFLTAAGPLISGNMVLSGPERGGSLTAGEGPGRVPGIASTSLIYFAALFFLYGGIESSLNGWLTTYALRYGRQGLSVSELSTLLFWIGLTLGRGLGSLLLRRIKERELRIAALIATVMVIAVLIFAHALIVISVCSVLIGLGLAPWFPVTLSLLLARGPRPQQAAIALAVTALGGAALSWMTGQVSTHLGSLDKALLLPLAETLVLLMLCLLPPPALNSEGG